jgi:hypothetical protein
MMMHHEPAGGMISEQEAFFQERIGPRLLAWREVSRSKKKQKKQKNNNDNNPVLDCK